MRVPHTISENVLEAYRCSIQTIELPEEAARTIQSENDKWDEYIIPDLTILALKVIVRNWPANPILESLPTCTDRDMLIEMLPLDLPFDLIIKHIPYEYYWKRASLNRWKYYNLSEHDDSWRQMYCERHFNEYLQQLDPKVIENEPNEFEELVQLLGNYIYTIKLRSLIPNVVEFRLPDNEDEDLCTTEKSLVHHIPLNIILPRLSNLRELYINIGMIYMNDGFEWKDFEFSVQDCFNLGNGIKECRSLKKLSFTRSNLDQPKVAALLQTILLNNNLEEIDFSHCTLSNTGALAVAGFLMQPNNLQILNLTNNDIGPDGFAGIVTAIISNNNLQLKMLNLRLNPLRDESGNDIYSLLRNYGQLEYLNISGCNLGTNVGMKIIKVLSTVNWHIPIFRLDVSNNDFDAEVGRAFEAAIESCAVVVEFDDRMCRFTEGET